MSKYCPECGEEVDEGQNFCDNCGTSLDTEDKNLEESKETKKEDIETKTKISRLKNFLILPLNKKKYLGIVLLLVFTIASIYFVFGEFGDKKIEPSNLIQVDSAEWEKADGTSLQGHVKVRVPEEAPGRVCVQLEDRVSLEHVSSDCISPGENKELRVSANKIINKVNIEYGRNSYDLEQIKSVNLGRPDIELKEVGEEQTFEISNSFTTSSYRSVKFEIKNQGNIPVDPYQDAGENYEPYAWSSNGFTKKIDGELRPGETGTIKIKVYFDPPDSLEQGDELKYEVPLHLTTVNEKKTIKKEATAVIQ
jgi:hypothetical protein